MCVARGQVLGEGSRSVRVAILFATLGIDAFWCSRHRVERHACSSRARVTHAGFSMHFLQGDDSRTAEL